MKNQQSQSGKPTRHQTATFELKIRALGAVILSDFKRLIAYVKKHGPFWIRQIKQNVKREGRQTVQAIRRVGQERVYRLKGYTTVAKINRKRQSERQQRFLRRVLLILFGFLLAILLANVYNPIKDFSEWYRIIGIHHITSAEVTTSKELN